ncbi:MAG: tetratricopeptide repeat protein [Thermodesulfobacteriota bacterium]|nr:tetratricopeptide repeat protein [Thermodesulfobacteriota bacterium]
MEKNKKKNLLGRPLFLAISILVIASFALGWWLWRGLSATSLRVNFVLIVLNHEPHKILSGETIVLHPQDKIKILDISTNIPFNLNVRLEAGALDVNALRYEEMSLAALLPGEEMFDHYRFRLRVKYRNLDIGFMDWEIRPYTEDWLEKANRTIKDSARLAILERAMSLQPTDRRLSRRLLDEYRSQEQWKEAARMLESMAGEESDREEILLDLLNVYTAMESLIDIISVLERLVEINPDNIEARQRLAEAFESGGKIVMAAKEYEDLLSRLDESERLPIYKRLGYLHANQGESEKAISYYLKAVKLDEQDANLYYNLSYLYDKIHQKGKADVYLEAAVGLEVNDVEGRLELSANLVSKKEFKKAEKYLSDILEERPGSLPALHLLAQVKEKQGEDGELKRIYEKILSLDSKNKTVIYNLGAIEYEAENLEASLHHFNRYVKLNPGDATAHGLMFDIYKKQKNTQMALKEALILIELTPEETSAYRYVFDCLNALNDYDNIIRVMEKGLKANPDKTEFREYLVWAYLKADNGEQAIKHMEEILKVRPKDIDLLLRLARFREKRGEITEALDTFKRIIDISPGHEEAEEAYLRLRLRGVQGAGG